MLLIHEVPSRDASFVPSFGFKLLSRSMCGTIQIVDVRVGEMCVVDGVPSDTCFRIGSGFFTVGWRVSSMFTYVVSLVLRNAKFIISREKFVVRSACLCAPSFVL